MKIFLDSIYRSLKLSNELADQSLLNSMVLAGKELSTLYSNYTTLVQMPNIVRILYGLLSGLQGKLPS